MTSDEIGEKAGATQGPATDCVERAGPKQRSPLGQLLDDLDRRSAEMANAEAATRSDAPPTAGRGGSGAAPELKSITRFGDTWSRLRAERRLRQSRAALPDNAGPLNSHHLVHRSLQLMREVSPEYLNRFMGHADALAALAELARAGTAAPAATRAAPVRKAARGKGG